MSRVFDGGEGEMRAGRFERSSDSGDLDLFWDNEPGEVEPDTGGEECMPAVRNGGSCVATDMFDSCVVSDTSFSCF